MAATSRPVHPDLPRQASDRLLAPLIAEVVAGLRSALASELAAVYLYGSAAVGGFDAGVSDLDLLIVTEHDVDAAAAAALESLHADIVERHPDWDDRLELVYVGREALARFRDGGPLAVVSPGERFHFRDDLELWVSNFYLVREFGIVLAGPEPSVLVPPASWQEFAAEIRRYSVEVQSRDIRAARPVDRAYAVLTMCRALSTLRAGRSLSKHEGASLIRSQMPAWAWLIDAAERCRLSRGRTGLADAATVQAAEEFVKLILDEIASTA